MRFRAGTEAENALFGCNDVTQPRLAKQTSVLINPLKWRSIFPLARDPYPAEQKRAPHPASHAALPPRSFSCNRHRFVFWARSSLAFASESGRTPLVEQRCASLAWGKSASYG